MRKLDLAQRKDLIGERTDVVLNHLDRKNNYSFPKIIGDVTKKKGHQIEFRRELESKYYYSLLFTNVLIFILLFYINTDLISWKKGVMKPLMICKVI